jgi:hypothetical protein
MVGWVPLNPSCDERKSAQPGRRFIESYAEARAAIPDDAPNETVEAFDVAWAGKVEQ